MGVPLFPLLPWFPPFPPLVAPPAPPVVLLVDEVVPLFPSAVADALAPPPPPPNVNGLAAAPPSPPLKEKPDGKFAPAGTVLNGLVWPPPKPPIPAVEPDLPPDAIAPSIWVNPPSLPTAPPAPTVTGNVLPGIKLILFTCVYPPPPPPPEAALPEVRPEPPPAPHNLYVPEITPGGTVKVPEEVKLQH
jgi:hypothetical protein